MQETERYAGLIPGSRCPLEEEMATHSCILAWRIPWKGGTWQAAIHRVAESDTTEATQYAHTQTHSRNCKRQKCTTHVTTIQVKKQNVACTPLKLLCPFQSLFLLAPPLGLTTILTYKLITFLLLLSFYHLFMHCASEILKFSIILVCLWFLFWAFVVKI